jgi:hypothetical protein
VLDHQHRVAARREVAQQAEQLLAVLRVEADRRLVEDVEGAGQPGAERGGEVDALRLAARQRPRLAVEGQVVEADAVQHLDPLADLVEQVPGELALARRPRARGEPGAEPSIDSAASSGGCALEPHRPRLGCQPRAAAVGAGS